MVKSTGCAYFSGRRLPGPLVQVPEQELRGHANEGAHPDHAGHLQPSGCRRPRPAGGERLAEIPIRVVPVFELKSSGDQHNDNG